MSYIVKQSHREAERVKEMHIQSQRAPYSVKDSQRESERVRERVRESQESHKERECVSKSVIEGQ